MIKNSLTIYLEQQTKDKVPEKREVTDLNTMREVIIQHHHIMINHKNA